MVKLNDYIGVLLARSWPVQCRCDFLGCLTGYHDESFRVSG